MFNETYMLQVELVPTTYVNITQNKTSRFIILSELQSWHRIHYCSATCPRRQDYEWSLLHPIRPCEKGGCYGFNHFLILLSEESFVMTCIQYGPLMKGFITQRYLYRLCLSVLRWIGQLLLLPMLLLVSS